MKKLLVVFLCLVMLLSVVACDKKKDKTTTPAATTPAPKTAAQLVSEAIAKITPEKGVDMAMVITATEDDEPETMSMGFKVVKKSDGTFNFSMTMTEDDETMTTTLVDGTVYMEMEGMKVKTTNVEDMLGDMNAADMSDNSVDQAVLNALPATAPALADGKYTITFSLTGDAILAALGDHPYFGSMMDPDMIEGITFSNYQGTIVIDANGNLVSESASFTVTNERYPDEVMTYTSTITYNNPGQQVTVTAPADADTYMDMDSMQ